MNIFPILQTLFHVEKVWMSLGFLYTLPLYLGGCDLYMYSYALLLADRSSMRNYFYYMTFLFITFLFSTY